MLMLYAFLNDRIEEDEAVIEGLDDSERLPRSPGFGEMPVWDKRRLQEECASKRAVLENFSSYLGESHPQLVERYELEAWRVLQSIVKAMALPYADHPGYQMRWHPN